MQDNKTLDALGLTDDEISKQRATYISKTTVENISLFISKVCPLIRECGKRCEFIDKLVQEMKQQCKAMIAE